MTTSLAGVRAKLARADTHISNLGQITGPLAGAAEDSMLRETDGDPSRIAFRVGHVPAIQPEWSTIVGDALFNLRSALDHLAWQLVRLDDGEPCEHTQFPIYPSRLNAKGNPRVITIQPQIRSQAILAALERVQPFREVDHGHSADEATLWLVNHFCNIDKHRLLLVMVHSVDFDELAHWGLPDGVPSPAWWLNDAPLQGGDTVARFDFHGTPAPAHFDPHISLAIALNEGPAGHWIRQRDVATLLAEFRREISTEINLHFIKLFPGEARIIWPGY